MAAGKRMARALLSARNFEKLSELIRDFELRSSGDSKRFQKLRLNLVCQGVDALDTRATPTNTIPELPLP
jgi:hypothetical protein